MVVGQAAAHGRYRNVVALEVLTNTTTSLLLPIVLHWL